MSASAGYGLDWRPDLPDPRDFTPTTETVAALLRGLRPLRRLPERVDWSEYIPAAEAAAPAGASVAEGCVQMLRYFERRASGQILDPSRRFLHQATGRVMGTCDSCGCELRSALKTLARFGAPPRRLWPDEVPLDAQPDAFVYAAATRFAPLYYTRLDDRCASPEAALKSLRSFVAAGFAVVFGLPLFGAPTSDAEIALPTVFDFVRGGAAVVALGYDDARRLPAGKGALLVRMPWGRAWGERGFGWLPYGYVRERLAIDFWTLVKPEWLASGEFLRPV